MLDFFFYWFLSSFLQRKKYEWVQGAKEKKQVQTGLNKITVGPVNGFLGMCNVHF